MPMVLMTAYKAAPLRPVCPTFVLVSTRKSLTVYHCFFLVNRVMIHKKLVRWFIFFNQQRDRIKIIQPVVCTNSQIRAKPPQRSISTLQSRNLSAFNIHFDKVHTFDRILLHKIIDCCRDRLLRRIRADRKMACRPRLREPDRLTASTSYSPIHKNNPVFQIRVQLHVFLE